MSDKKLWDFHQNENRKHLIYWYQRQDKIFKQIKKYLKKTVKTLEIWFWDWYLLNKMSLYWYNVTWQDLSESNIDLTKKQWNNNKINFILWDESWKLQLENNSIDWFIASEVLEHMNEVQLKICIDEIYRILKNEWYVFITVPFKEDLKLNECSCPNCWEVFHKWGHKQYWDIDIIKDKFSNFEIIYITDFFNRYTWKNTFEKIIWYVMFFIRNILNKFVFIDWKSYLIILKKL